jgi:hypothetical protein
LKSPAVIAHGDLVYCSVCNELPYRKQEVSVYPNRYNITPSPGEMALKKSQRGNFFTAWEISEINKALVVFLNVDTDKSLKC